MAGTLDDLPVSAAAAPAASASPGVVGSESPGVVGLARAALNANALLVDLVVALVLAALALFPFVVGAPGVGLRGEAAVLLLLQTLPLALRRRYALAVFAVVVGATLAQLAVAEGPVRSGLGVMVAVFSVAERLDRRTSAAHAAGSGPGAGCSASIRAGARPGS